MYVSWGSLNVGGSGYCWTGVIAGTDFDGLLTGMKLVDAELDADAVKGLAATPP